MLASQPLFLVAGLCNTTLRMPLGLQSTLLHPNYRQCLSGLGGGWCAAPLAPPLLSHISWRLQAPLSSRSRVTPPEQVGTRGLDTGSNVAGSSCLEPACPGHHHLEGLLVPSGLEAQHEHT